MTSENSVRAGRREWLGLVVLALPTLLLSLDVSVLFLALPHLSADLGADATQQLWITDIYGFMIAGLLVTMGTLGDRIGRRRLLLVGAAAFGAASVLAAFSVSPEMLIATRALLGIAGATLVPSTLALIINMFADSAQRTTAIAVFVSCFMGGSALGPLVGGVLLESFWWGSVFLLGVPVMALLLIAGPMVLPEYRDPGAGRLDLTSVALSMAAILPIIYGLKETAKGGWGALPAVAIVAGAIFAVTFVRRQRRLADPLLDLRLFASRSFSATLGIMVLGGMIMGGVFLLVSQYAQLVQGLSPLRSGLALMPAPLALIAGAMLAPGLARRFRPAHVMAAGLAVSALGYLLLSRVEAADGLPLLMTGLVLVFAGSGPPLALGTDLVVGSAPPEKAGSAASVDGTSKEFGIAMGIAVIGSISTAVYRGQIADTPSGVPADAVNIARESLAGAVSIAGRVPELLGPARDAFTTGLNIAAGLGAVLHVSLALITVIMLRHARPIGEAIPQAETAAGASSQAETAAGASSAQPAVDRQPDAALVAPDPRLGSGQARTP